MSAYIQLLNIQEWMNNTGRSEDFPTDKIEAELNEVETLRRERDDYKQALGDLGVTPEEARAGAQRSREMRRDAERYRTLRNMVYLEDIGIGEAYLRLKVIGACPTTQQFDAAIDASRKGEE